MEIFKLYESTMANVKPGPHMKHLRRDQLLDNYDAAANTLQTLIQAKETEIKHRQDLIKMLEESKSFHDSRLMEAKEEYQIVKTNIPASVDLKAIEASLERSTTPPLPPPPQAIRQPSYQPISTTTSIPPGLPMTTSMAAPVLTPPVAATGANKSFDIPLPSDNYTNNRSSLDRRLSEFMKTFPNLSQAGAAAANNNDAAKPPALGYYTQQPPPPPPPTSMSAAPPSIDMLRFPPPNMLPPGHGPPIPPPPIMHQNLFNQHHQENHDPADMEMSDNEDGGSLPPMIASALQQGAGGKTQPPSYPGSGAPQQFNNPVAYNALPFDPSIMDPSFGGSPSSSSGRDRYSGDKSSGHRHSSGSGGSGKHGSSSGKKYASSSSSTSSHSSSRGKTRR